MFSLLNSLLQNTGHCYTVYTFFLLGRCVKAKNKVVKISSSSLGLRVGTENIRMSNTELHLCNALCRSVLLIHVLLTLDPDHCLALPGVSEGYLVNLNAHLPGAVGWVIPPVGHCLLICGRDE